MSASLLQDARDLLAGMSADTPPSDIAAACAEALGATILALRDDPERGDVAFDGPAGGFGADPWGEGETRPRKVARVIGARPGCLFGLRCGDQRVVIDPETMQVRPERQRAIASLSGGPRKSRAQSVMRRKAEAAPLPQPPSVDNAKAAVSAALAEQARLESDSIMRRAALLSLERRKTEATRRAERARKAFGKEAADAVARGEAIPDMPRQREAIVRGETESAACDAARPAAQANAKVAEAALAEHSRIVAIAALDLDAALAGVALPTASAAIGALVEPLAALFAVSIVRERLLGVRFPVDPRRHAPIGAAQIVAGFVESIPTPLRSDTLTIEAIEMRATAIAEAHLAEVQPQQSES